MKLKYHYSELEAKKVNPLPTKFNKGERLNVLIKEKGWFQNQVIAVSKNRALTIMNCDELIGKNIKVRILETRDNIYLAEPVRQKIRI